MLDSNIRLEVHRVALPWEMQALVTVPQGAQPQLQIFDVMSNTGHYFSDSFSLLDLHIAQISQTLPHWPFHFFSVPRDQYPGVGETFHSAL